MKAAKTCRKELMAIQTRAPSLSIQKHRSAKLGLSAPSLSHYPCAKFHSHHSRKTLNQGSARPPDAPHHISHHQRTGGSFFTILHFLISRFSSFCFFKFSFLISNFNEMRQLKTDILVPLCFLEFKLRFCTSLSTNYKFHSFPSINL